MKGWDIGMSINWSRARKDWLMIGLFILAVLVKSILLRTYLSINADRSLQLVAAESWAKGHGYTVPQVLLGNLQMVKHLVLLEWPPLYSAMLVPLMWVTNYDFVLSSGIMDSLGAFAYLLAIWRIAALLNFSPWIQQVAIWFKATEIYEGFFSSGPTDFIAAACWLWALYYILKYIQNPSLKLLLLVITGIGSAVLFRYAYIATVPILPILLYWSGHVRNNLAWKKAAGIITAGLFLIIGGYLLFNKIETGQFTYLESWHKGFYPGKLRNMVPVFWQSITHVTFICVQMELHFHRSFYFFHKILQYSSWLILCVLFFPGIKFFLSNRWQLTRRTDKNFFLIGTLVSTVIILTLMLLSIRIEFPVEAFGHSWSYLIEDRYYLIPFTVVLFVLLGFLFPTVKGRARGIRFLQSLLLCAFLVQVSHAGWILKKRIPLIWSTNPLQPENVSAKRNTIEKLFSEAKNSTTDIVLLTNISGHTYFALTHGIKVCRQIYELDDTAFIGVSKPTTVILTLKPHEVANYSAALKKFGFMLRKELPDEMYFTTTLIPAHWQKKNI